MTNVTTDYAHLLTLPAGAELRRAVAELAGWRNFMMYVDMTVLGTPPGIPISHREEVPAYDTDTDAALGLLPADMDIYFDRYVGSIPPWQVYLSSGIPEEVSYIGTSGTADTPALAIVRAFIRWKAAQ